jgi:hypothetical protein
MITACEACAFAVIHKDVYRRVLLKIELKAKAKIDAFLLSTPVFKGLN